MIFLVPRWDEFPGGLVSPPWSNLLEANAKLRGVQMSNSLVAPGGSVGCFQYPKNVRTCTMGIWWYYPLNQLMWVNLFKKTNVTFNSKCSRTESPLQCNNYVAFVTRGEPFSKSGEVSKCLQIYLEIRNQTTCSWVRKPNLSKSLQFLSKRIQKQYVFRFQSFLFNATSLKSSFKTQNPVPATKDPFMGRAFAWLGAGAMVVSGSANHHISTWVFPEILAGDFRIKTIFLRKHRGCKNSRIHPEGTVSVDWTVGCPLRSISWFSGTSPKPRPSD